MTRLFTEEQKHAIYDGGNLLVSAAAGSGKTSVLTERIARLVLEGCCVNELLVVTFTKAAAGEMKKRIAARLLEVSETLDDDAEVQRLRTAASETARANISTLHSFCGTVLRRYFHEADLDPAFRVMDGAEAAVMLEDALEAYLEDACAADDPAFTALLDAIEGTNNLADAIRRTYHFMQGRPDPTLWLDAAEAVYDAPNSAEDLADSLAETVRAALLARRAEHANFAADLADIPKYANALGADVELLDGICAANGYTAMREALFAAEFAKMSTARDTLDQQTRDAVKKVREKTRDYIKKCVADTFALSLAEKEAVLRKAAPHVKKLIACIRAFEARYRAVKNEKNVIDFSDMEHLALSVLRKERVAAAYRAKFRAVFVDEYQDSNLVQEAILNAIRREDNLFLVGDVKQSIYRFRLAEPSLFLEKFDAFAQGRGGHRIDLSMNFRSGNAVINFVNELFAKVMSRASGEIDYDDAARLRRGAERVDGSVEVHLIDRALAHESSEDDGEDEEHEALTNCALEAMVAAERILALVQEGKRGDGEPIRYKDVAVLLRATRASAELWTETLSLMGVPAYADLTGGYFEAVEIKVFLSLLRCIDNRRQDVHLLSVLRSSVGGFTTEDLIHVASLREKGATLLDALSVCAAEDTPCGAKAAGVLAKLDAWRTDAQLYTVEELLGKLLDETGFYRFVCALPGGARRQANLDALIERARAYGKSGGRGLWNFLQYMDRVELHAELGSAQTGEADVVRVMSIHKSKGLEFPVVIVGDLGKCFNTRGLYNDIALPDTELGLGVKLRLDRVRETTLVREAILHRAKMQQKSEEMRILYVALTRAQERLILLGTSQNLALHAQRLCQSMTSALSASANCYLDWILPVLLENKAGNPLRELFHGIPVQGVPIASVFVRHAFGAAMQQGTLAEHAFSNWTEQARFAQTSMLEERFSWTYPHEKDALLPSKVSVTGLTQRSVQLVDAPAFLAENRALSAEARGSAAHTLMEYISLQAHTPESVSVEIACLRERGILSEREAEAVSPASVAAFFASEIGKRMLASSCVWREKEFNFLVSAGEIYDDAPDTPILVQGVIDCCFKEADGWVILDYKTDAVSSPRFAKRTALRHAPQVRLYAAALSRLTGTPVKEAYIHLLRIGESVAIPLVK